MLRTIFTSLLLCPCFLPASASADQGGTDITATETEATETTEAGPAEAAEGGISALDEFKRRHEVVMLLVKSTGWDCAV